MAYQEYTNTLVFSLFKSFKGNLAYYKEFQLLKLVQNRYFIINVNRSIYI